MSKRIRLTDAQTVHLFAVAMCGTAKHLREAHGIRTRAANPKNLARLHLKAHGHPEDALPGPSFKGVKIC